VDFTVNERQVSLTATDVEKSLRGITAEDVRTHGVRIGDTIYPVKQALEVATGISRDEFTSQTARRLLERLGFPLTGTSTARTDAGRTAPAVSADPRAWPWEGAVQDMFADWLRRREWSITGTADTATKAHGVDLLALSLNPWIGAGRSAW
jgi:hypothetical protein